jgi:hypothetical protein
MPRVTTVEVSRPILNSMFRKFNVWGRIRAGNLVSDIVASKPSSTWPNATSQIVKHFTIDGKHLATTHRVQDSDGQVLH